MNQARRSLLFFGLICVCLIVAGCAVLTVDVDVYKGPLANTEQIQGEQAISLAMGAKPLLLNLRDQSEISLQLETWNIFANPDKLLNDSLAKLRSQDWYKAGYIAPYQPDHPGSTTNHCVFSNPYAYELNEILSMYDDQDPSGLSGPTSEVEALLEDYTHQYEIYSKYGKSEWPALKQYIQTQQLPSGDLTAKLLVNYEQFFNRSNYTAEPGSFSSWPFVDAAAGISAEQAKTLKLLVPNDACLDVTSNLYMRLIDPSITNIFSGGRTNNISPAALITVGGTNYISPLALITNVSKNFQFDYLLQRKSFVDGILLFTNPADPRLAEFTNLVETIAGSHFKGREDLHQILRIVLQMAIHQQVSGVAGEPSSLLTRKTLVDLAAPIISANRLARQMDADPDPTLKVRFSDELSLVSTNLQFSGVLHSTYQTQTEWNAINQAVHQLLLDEYTSIFPKLLEYDRLLAADKNETDQFGLVYAPYYDWSTLLPINVESLVLSFKAAAGGSLSRGRQRDGLETLIEKYLDQRSTMRDPLAWQTNEPFLDLLSALTEFGEKITTLANNDQFQKSVIPFTKIDGENYVMTLQSVGNSILVQIDELKAWTAHQQNLRDKSQLFGEALAQSGNFTNAGMEYWWASNKLAVVPLDAKDATEQLQNILRIEYLKELQNEADAAKAKSAESGGPGNPPSPSFNLLTHVTFAGDGTLITASRPLIDFNAAGPLTTNTVQVALTCAGTNAQPVPVTAGLPKLILNLEFATAGILTNVDVALAQPNVSYFSRDSFQPGVSFDITFAINTNQAIAGWTIGNVVPAGTPKMADAPVVALPPAGVPAPTNSAPSSVSPPMATTPALNTNVAPNAAASTTPPPVSNPAGPTPADAANPKSGQAPSATFVVEVKSNLAAVKSTAPVTNSAASKYLAALQAATDLRAGMIYLRPASSYLRSSFTVSSASSDQGLIWNNMLEQQGWRSIPLLPGWIDNSKAKINADQDKQSWQNINRIRVAGGGEANYVLVKDDIGNWYVKSFADNPTNMFSSIAGLAQYAAGGSLPVLAKGALTNAASLISAAASSSGSNMTNGVLAAELFFVTTNYLAHSADYYSNAFNEAAALDARVESLVEWAGLTNSLATKSPIDLVLYTNVLRAQNKAFGFVTNTLTNAVASLASVSRSGATNLSLSLNYAAAYNQQLVNVLKSIKTYTVSLQDLVYTNQEYGSTTAATIGSGATTNATNLVNKASDLARKLNDFATQQTKAMDDYELNLNMISHLSTGN